MDYLEKMDALLNLALMIIGGTALIALMLLATGNVALRIFHLPFSGTYEVLSFLGAVVIASALGYTQRNKDHIVVDIVTERYPGVARRLINGVSYAATTAFFAVITWQVFLWGRKISESGELSETLKIIYHPFIYIVSLGFGALTIACCLDLLQTILKAEGDRR